MATRKGINLCSSGSGWSRTFERVRSVPGSVKRPVSWTEAKVTDLSISATASPRNRMMS
jgi:hypothetical protein